MKIINVLKLISPLPVSVNHYIKPRAFITYGKPQVTLYETNEAKKYKKEFKEYVKKEILKQGFTIIPNKTQHFYIDCIFYFDRIDRDCNNYFKLLLDAITETQSIWLDDNVTCERVNRIYYDSNNPRIELLIYPTDYIGVFDNASQLEEFETNCIGCTRYKRNCSILQKAKEGRIQEEIVNLRCSKYKKSKEK